MRFTLIDIVLEQTPDRIVALKNVTLAEEYLGDHFPGFPVLPGVFMVEAMVQAARRLLDAEGSTRHVLGSVKALRYGNFVRPGEALRVEVSVDRRLPDGSVQFKGTGRRVSVAGPGGKPDPGSKSGPNPGPDRQAVESTAGQTPGGAVQGVASGRASSDSRGEADTAVSGRFTMRPLRSAAST